LGVLNSKGAVLLAMRDWGLEEKTTENKSGGEVPLLERSLSFYGKENRG